MHFEWTMGWMRLLCASLLCGCLCTLAQDIDNVAKKEMRYPALTICQIFRNGTMTVVDKNNTLHSVDAFGDDKGAVVDRLTRFLESFEMEVKDEDTIKREEDGTTSVSMCPAVEVKTESIDAETAAKTDLILEGTAHFGKTFRMADNLGSDKIDNRETSGSSNGKTYLKKKETINDDASLENNGQRLEKVGQGSDIHDTKDEEKTATESVLLAMTPGGIDTDIDTRLTIASNVLSANSTMVHVDNIDKDVKNSPTISMEPPVDNIEIIPLPENIRKLYPAMISNSHPFGGFRYPHIVPVDGNVMREGIITDALQTSMQTPVRHFMTHPTYLIHTWPFRGIVSSDAVPANSVRQVTLVYPPYNGYPERYRIKRESGDDNDKAKKVVKRHAIPQGHLKPLGHLSQAHLKHHQAHLAHRQAHLKHHQAHLAHRQAHLANLQAHKVRLASHIQHHWLKHPLLNGHHGYYWKFLKPTTTTSVVQGGVDSMDSLGARIGGSSDYESTALEGSDSISSASSLQGTIGNGGLSGSLGGSVGNGLGGGLQGTIGNGGLSGSLGGSVGSGLGGGLQGTIGNGGLSGSLGGSVGNGLGGGLQGTIGNGGLSGSLGGLVGNGLGGGLQGTIGNGGLSGSLGGSVGNGLGGGLQGTIGNGGLSGSLGGLVGHGLGGGLQGTIGHGGLSGSLGGLVGKPLGGGLKRSIHKREVSGSLGGAVGHGLGGGLKGFLGNGGLSGSLGGSINSVFGGGLQGSISSRGLSGSLGGSGGHVVGGALHNGGLSGQIAGIAKYGRLSGSVIG